MFNSPSEILVISSQSLVNALPKIPALSKADTATHMCFVFDLEIFGKASPEANAPPTARLFRDLFKNFLLFISILWWAEQGSNLRPIACRAIALPAELSAQGDDYTIKINNQQ